jgi:hypothetical protein
MHGAERQPTRGRNGRISLEQEDDLEQRRVGQAPLRLEGLDELLEGEVLVIVSFQGGVPRPPQDLQEGGIAGQVATQDQGVHKEADEPLGLSPVAIRDRSADRQVVPPGVAPKEGLEDRQQGHEGGRAGATGQRLQAGGEVRRQDRARHSAARGAHGRTRPVRGQVQHGRQAGEALAPPGDLRVERPAGQPAPLPGREVRVLDR